MKRKVLLYFTGCSFCLVSKTMHREIVAAADDDNPSFQDNSPDVYDDYILNPLNNLSCTFDQGFKHGNLLIEKTNNGLTLITRNENKFYRIPPHHFLTLELKEYNSGKVVSLYFISGDSVEMKTHGGLSGSFELQDISPGPYMLRIINSEKNITEIYKILKY